MHSYIKETEKRYFLWFSLFVLCLFSSCETKQNLEESPYKKIVERLSISGDWKAAIKIATLELENPQISVEDELYFLFSKGDNFRFSENYELAEQFFKKVIDHPNAIENPRILGEAMYGLGDLNYIKWSYFKIDDALVDAKYYLDSSMSISRKYNLLALESKNLYRSGTILQIQGEHEQSIKNFRKGLDISFAIADTVGMIRNDVHKAAELERMGLLDSALYHDTRSYIYAKSQNRNYSEAHSLCNLGQFYFNLEKLDSAERYFKLAEFLSEELHHGIVRCRSYYNLARFNAKVGDMESAEKYYEKGISLAREKGYKNFENGFEVLGESLFD